MGSTVERMVTVACGGANNVLVEEIYSVYKPRFFLRGSRDNSTTQCCTEPIG